jgi:hypothetical protein
MSSYQVLIYWVFDRFYFSSISLHNSIWDIYPESMEFLQVQSLNQLLEFPIIDKKRIFEEEIQKANLPDSLRLIQIQLKVHQHVFHQI